MQNQIIVDQPRRYKYAFTKYNTHGNILGTSTRDHT